MKRVATSKVARQTAGGWTIEHAFISLLTNKPSTKNRELEVQRVLSRGKLVNDMIFFEALVEALEDIEGLPDGLGLNDFKRNPGLTIVLSSGLRKEGMRRRRIQDALAATGLKKHGQERNMSLVVSQHSLGYHHAETVDEGGEHFESSGASLEQDCRLTNTKNLDSMEGCSEGIWTKHAARGNAGEREGNSATLTRTARWLLDGPKCG